MATSTVINSPASILSSLRPFSISPAAAIHERLGECDERITTLLKQRSQLDHFIHLYQSGRGLIALVKAIKPVDEFNVRYVARRTWGIVACSLTSIPEAALRLVYPELPRISLTYALYSYGELWFRVSALLDDRRPKLFSELDRIS